MIYEEYDVETQKDISLKCCICEKTVIDHYEIDGLIFCESCMNDKFYIKE